MSRSYRKPWYVDGYGTKRKKFYKRQASKKTRRAGDVPDGKAYRKFFDPWEIADYRYPWSPRRYFIPNVLTGEVEETGSADPKWRVMRK
jgi:hypothetical protein